MGRPKKIVMEKLDFDPDVNDLISESKETEGKSNSNSICSCPQCNQELVDWELFKTVVEESIEYFVKKYGTIKVSSRGLVHERRVILSVNSRSSIKRGNGVYYISSSKKSGFGFSIATGDNVYHSPSAFVKFTIPKTDETTHKRLTLMDGDYSLTIPDSVSDFKVNLIPTENVRYVLSTISGTFGVTDFCARLQEVIINDI
jgi:hypothetical protein